MPPLLRPADKNDYIDLYRFTNAQSYLHRHLDWRDTLEWLGRQPFWILEDRGELQAALACPPEPPDVSWVRLFAVSDQTSPDLAWKMLFNRSLEILRSLPEHPVVVSLAMREWYENLLLRNRFTHHQDIVVFIFEEEPPPPPRLDPDFRLRDMRPGDLDAITIVDHLAFEPIWRLSLDDLSFAGQKSAYCTVMERNGEIVGYQMSSSSGMYAHLSRLAIHPDLQGRRLGFALVQDLLDHFINRLSYWGITLNTQHDNATSIALYQKIGFRETGERFPVYIYR